jgi:glutathione synthase/RimK-type ligase-like ATP-grasp enzyme
MTRAVLFKSLRRYESFAAELHRAGCEVTTLDFEEPAWREFDFAAADVLIYFPHFQHSSNHPLALRWAIDDLAWIARRHPRLRIFPDPALLEFYSDKYRQFRHLQAHGLPIPETYAVETPAQALAASAALGWPVIVKNRFGAGGDYVARVEKAEELLDWVAAAGMEWSRRGALWLQARRLLRREFLRALKRGRQAEYPFLSLPLIVQKFCPHDRDLKVVAYRQRAIEAHWRVNAAAGQWKMNIDGGGAGIWSHVPDAALDVSRRLAATLGSRWLNIDLIPQGERFLISEFSPVWHHYRVREKPGFQYDASYNLALSWDESENIERLIVESLLAELGAPGSKPATAAAGRDGT